MSKTSIKTIGMMTVKYSTILENFTPFHTDIVTIVNASNNHNTTSNCTTPISSIPVLKPQTLCCQDSVAGSVNILLFVTEFEFMKLLIYILIIIISVIFVRLYAVIF